MAQFTLTIETSGRSTTDITGRIAQFVQKADVKTGLCNVFVHHTSASLMLCENADPSVRRDLEMWFSRAVQDGDPAFTHTMEGPDDMSAHIRSILTTNSLSLPITGGRLALGTWQGIFLWEHRTHAHRRQLTVTTISG